MKEVILKAASTAVIILLTSSLIHLTSQPGSKVEKITAVTNVIFGFISLMLVIAIIWIVLPLSPY
jgi:hypothetical protein